MATEVNKIIFSIEVSDKGVVRKIGNATVSVNKFEKELRKATQANKQFNDTLSGRESMITNAGLAGATLTELGRTISDLPYGIRGIANNLSQLSTLFVTMVSKVDGSVKGFARVGKAFKMLTSQLMGPLGLILAFQAVIALLDAFAGKSKKAAEETDKLNEALRGQDALNQSMQVYIDVLKDANSTEEQRLVALGKLQKQGYDETIGTLEEYQAALKQAQKLEIAELQVKDKIAESEGKIAEATEKRDKAQKELDELHHNSVLRYSREQRIKKADELIASEQAIIDSQLDGIRNFVQELENDPSIAGNPFIADMFGVKKKKTDDSPAKGTVAAIQNSIKELEKLRDETATTGEEFDSFTAKIQKLQDELNELQGTQEREEIESVNAFKKREEEKETTLKEAFLKRLRQRNFENDLDEENHKKDLKRIEDRIAAQERLFSFINQQAGQFAQIQSQAFDAQVDRLNTERDIILNNDNLTAQEKDKLLKENDKKTRDIRIKQIKFERDMFQLEAAMELAKLALQGKTLLAGVIGTGAKQTAEATGSIGKFLTELGPIAGPIAYAAMIGGVIAQIATARKKAEQQIKALSGPLAGVSSGGGGSAPIAPPAFNVVGATQTSQLAQTISQAEQQPLRAYVVASDISTAQELERSTIEGASIG